VPGTARYGADAQLHGGGKVFIDDKQQMNVGAVALRRRRKKRR
jgi:hypothetical protein